MSEWVEERPIIPKVIEEREFIEIAEDFADPLEIFREAISNSFDAGATQITILVSTFRKGSRDILRIEIIDDGKGMNRSRLEAFFDLGNSTNSQNSEAIGEKGHGTKIYYKSSRIEVITCDGHTELRALVENPYDEWTGGKKPAINISSRLASRLPGTRIIVDDYNHSIRDRFTHAQIRDYVLWFTKLGSVEKEFEM